MSKVAIVGAGLGGLACAVRLAAAGFEVDIFEQAAGPGGKAGTLELGEWRFDTGPSLLTMPFVVDDLFADAGVDRADRLGIEPLDVLCRYWFADGNALDTVSDPNAVAEGLADRGWAERAQADQYFAHCRAIWYASAELFLLRPMTGLLRTVREIGLGRTLRTIANVRDLDVGRTMHEANASFFDDPRVVQLFDRRATYAGSSPYQAPATLNIIQHVDYALGGFVIEGGVYSLVRTLHQLAEELGVTFYFDAPVERMLTDGQRVDGIEVAGERVPADAVVSNADVNATYADLLDDTQSRPARRYASLEPSSSAVVFYWGVRDTHPHVDVHNILFSADYEAEFEDLFANRTCHHDPTVYIYVSSKYAPDDAPEGCENWFVMVNAPHDSGQDWQSETGRVREAVLRKIRDRLGVDLAGMIEEAGCLTPPDLQRKTGSRLGSIYGISSNSQWAAFQRQRNRSGVYRGLYFCGGSAHPGGGMPLVMLSGKMAAEHVKEDLPGR